MFALPIFTVRAIYRPAVANVRWTFATAALHTPEYRKRTKPKLGSLCSRYLFSRLGQLSFAVKKHTGGMFQAKKNLLLS